MDVTKDGRSWRIGTASDVAWVAGHTTQGFSITTAIPPVFDAYATFYPPDGISFEAHERAVVDELTEHTPAQPWWLGTSPACPGRPVLALPRLGGHEGELPVRLQDPDG